MTWPARAQPGRSDAEKAQRRKEVAHVRKEKERKVKTYLEAATQGHNSRVSMVPAPTDPTQMPKVTVSGQDPYIWRPPLPHSGAAAPPPAVTPPEPPAIPPDPEKKKKEERGPSYMRSKWDPAGPGPSGGVGKPDCPPQGFPQDEVLIAPIVSKWKSSGPGPARPKTLDELNASGPLPGALLLFMEGLFIVWVSLTIGPYWSIPGLAAALSLWWLPRVVRRSWVRIVRKNPEKTLSMRLANKVEFDPWSIYGKFVGTVAWTVITLYVSCVLLTGYAVALRALTDVRVLFGFFLVMTSRSPEVAVAIAAFGLFMGGIAWPRLSSKMRLWFYRKFAFADCPQVTVLDRFGAPRWEHHPALPSHEANVMLLSDHGPTEYGVFQDARVRHYVDGILIYEQIMAIPVTQVRNYMQNINLVAKNSLFAREGLDPNALREYVAGFVTCNTHALKLSGGDWVHTASYACVAIARAEAYRHFWSGPVILG